MDSIDLAFQIISGLLCWTLIGSCVLLNVKSRVFTLADRHIGWAVAVLLFAILLIGPLGWVALFYMWIKDDLNEYNNMLNRYCLTGPRNW